MIRPGLKTGLLITPNAAVEEYPEYAAAWNLLGQARLSIGDRVGARDAFHKAMGADDKYLGPYLPLLRMELQGKRWNEVDEVGTRLLRLDRRASEARFYRAVANFNLGNLQMAEQLAVEVQSGEDAASGPRRTIFSAWSLHTKASSRWRLRNTRATCGLDTSGPWPNKSGAGLRNGKLLG